MTFRKPTHKQNELRHPILVSIVKNVEEIADFDIEPRDLGSDTFDYFFNPLVKKAPYNVPGARCTWVIERFSTRLD